MMANMTQKPESPVRLPRILGPMTFPSSCCNTRIQIRNHSALMGLSIKIKSVAGTAPITGPKKGITLVTPTSTETSTVLGILKMVQPI